MKRGSLRTQLIGWNIVALALLLGVLGVVIRYTIVSTLMLSVERTLESRMRSFRMPPQMGRGGGMFRRGGNGPDGWRPRGGERPDRGGSGGFGIGISGGIPGGFPMPPPGESAEGSGSGSGGGGERRRQRQQPSALQQQMLDSPADPRHFDTGGRPIGPRQMLSRASFDAAARTGRPDTRRVAIRNEPHLVLSVPLREQGRLAGVGQIAYPLAEIDRAVSSLDTALLTLLPVGLLGAAAGGVFLTNRVLRRVSGTTRAAENIIRGGAGAEAFAARLPVSGNDEFSELSATFNGLLGRLETAFRHQERALEQQRRFTADASHELKTPLTVIKGTASMALSASSASGSGGGTEFTEPQYRAALTQIDQASTTMAKLVQDLLVLARADSAQLGANRIDLLAAEIVERAVQSVPHPEHKVAVSIADPQLLIHGNESELTRLVTNLFDNAVRYTPPGGTVTLSAEGNEGQVVLRVADTGIGIAPEHLAHLGERFYRADAARARADGGTGLGLSICRGIAAAHGGALEIESAPGAGTVVTVRLPEMG